MVNPNQQIGLVSRQDLYAMDVDQGSNCYSCEGFSYIARNCRNRGVVE